MVGILLFMAALSGIDPQLYEATIVDGSIIETNDSYYYSMYYGTIVVVFILRLGGLMEAGFEQILFFIIWCL